jgi:crotonobetainyl-CoA:carnitine CoA-transferase CaiB-like acyl-CoA transferase
VRPKSVPIIVEPSTVWQNHKRFQLCRGSIFCSERRATLRSFLMGADTVNVCPHSHYQTKDGKWIAIACTSDQMFARLAEVMQQPELASAERYGPKELRLAARDDVNRIVAEWVASLDLETVLAHCSRGGVPASLIYSIADIFEDPQYRARGNIQMADSRAGQIAVPGVVPRLSETPVEIR